MTKIQYLKNKVQYYIVRITTGHRKRQENTEGKGKGKGHPCTGTEALYRPYGP